MLGAIFPKTDRPAASIFWSSLKSIVTRLVTTSPHPPEVSPRPPRLPKATSTPIALASIDSIKPPSKVSKKASEAASLNCSSYICPNASLKRKPSLGEVAPPTPYRPNWETAIRIFCAPVKFLEPPAIVGNIISIALDW